MTEEARTFSPDEERWEKIQALTDGAALICYQCGMCTASCPWGLVRDIGLSIRTMIRQAQLGLFDEDNDIWRCTTCGRCEVTCPRGVRITDVIRGLRYLAWEDRKTPEGFPSLMWSVYWNNNPWFQPPSHRAEWAEKMTVPAYTPDHEYLLYVGCTVSYDHRAQKIAKSLVHILNQAGVSYGILGNDEPCCGEPVLAVGHLPYFEDIMKKNVEFYKEKNVRKIITISPHCYDTMKNHYTWPEGTTVEVLHYSEILRDLLREGKLNIKKTNGIRIAYHDPCFLARHNNVIEAPREAIQTLSENGPVEFSRNADFTLCCGGGGGRMWLETKADERFSHLRIQEAQEKNVNVLLTTCPMCLACLEDSKNDLGAQNMTILDVAEFLSQNLKS